MSEKWPKLTDEQRAIVAHNEAEGFIEKAGTIDPDMLMHLSLLHTKSWHREQREFARAVVKYVEEQVEKRKE